MKNVIRFIEEAFNEEPGPDLIAALPEMPVPRIETFIDLYMEHAKKLDSVDLQVPPKTLSHCRPVLAADEIFPELNPHKNSFDPQSISLNALSKIQQHLLYCHSLAVIDPFTDLPKRGKFPDEIFRQWFASYVSFLSMARPLVENDLLLILPISFNPTAVFGIEESLNAGKQIFPAADFKDFRPVEHEFFGSFLLSIAIHRLTQTLQAQLFFDQMVDAYLPYSYYELHSVA